jgi:hypothetical protein
VLELIEAAVGADDDGVRGGYAGEDLDAGEVADAGLHEAREGQAVVNDEGEAQVLGSLVVAGGGTGLLVVGFEQLTGEVAALAVDDGLDGNNQGVIVAGHLDVDVGSHAGFDVLVDLVNEDERFEGDDVAAQRFGALGADAEDMAGDAAAGVGLEEDAGGLVGLDEGGVGFVDSAADLHLGEVADDHDARAGVVHGSGDDDLALFGEEL